MYQQTVYTNFNPTQQGRMPCSSGHFDYHAPHPPTVRGSCNKTNQNHIVKAQLLIIINDVLTSMLLHVY